MCPIRVKTGSAFEYKHTLWQIQSVFIRADKVVGDVFAFGPPNEWISIERMFGHAFRMLIMDMYRTSPANILIYCYRSITHYFIHKHLGFGSVSHIICFALGEFDATTASEIPVIFIR